MHKIYELKEKLCKELEEYADKEKLDVNSVSVIDTLAHTIKNLDKILEKYEEDESGGRYSYDSRKMYPDYSMTRGNSYARGRGRMYSRYGGYSRAEDDMIAELQSMMQDLSPDKQHEVQKFIQRIELM